MDDKTNKKYFNVNMLHNKKLGVKYVITLDTDTSVWKSHNRTNGACHILPNTTGTNWHECRTIGGESSLQGNPPLILQAADANSWYNQKRIGKP